MMYLNTNCNHMDRLLEILDHHHIKYLRTITAGGSIHIVIFGAGEYYDVNVDGIDILTVYILDISRYVWMYPKNFNNWTFDYLSRQVINNCGLRKL